MNRPQLFERSVDVLVEAYFNDTLRHGDDCACAVGNLVAAELHGASTEADSILEWPNHSDGKGWYDSMTDYKYEEREVEIAEPLDYDNDEIVAIEDAFELAWFDEDLNENADKRFEGLMNVLDVLFYIHDVEDQSVREASRNRFAAA